MRHGRQRIVIPYQACTETNARCTTKISNKATMPSSISRTSQTRRRRRRAKGKREKKTVSDVRLLLLPSLSSALLLICACIKHTRGGVYYRTKGVADRQTDRRKTQTYTSHMHTARAQTWAPLLWLCQYRSQTHTTYQFYAFAFQKQSVAINIYAIRIHSTS